MIYVLFQHYSTYTRTALPLITHHHISSSSHYTPYFPLILPLMTPILSSPPTSPLTSSHPLIPLPSLSQRPLTATPYYPPLTHFPLTKTSPTHLTSLLNLLAPTSPHFSPPSPSLPSQEWAAAKQLNYTRDYPSNDPEEVISAPHVTVIA